MPDLQGEWLNTGRTLTRADLRGRPLLVDFWDYTCVNCLRTLPYLRAWHRRYALTGLVIVGVHSPEFAFGRIADQVQKAIHEYSIEYAVMLDNDYRAWDAYAVKAWPTKVLVDADGYLRYRVQGEGSYHATEAAIQALLRLENPNLSLPQLMEPLRPEDAPGAVCFRPTPELYAGYQRGGLFGAMLGNPDGYAVDGPIFYRYPPPERWAEGRFYLDGVWRAWPEALAFAGDTTGRVMIPYSAATVNAVLSPTADPVETILGLGAAASLSPIEVRQDGGPLTRANAGEDIVLTGDGRSVVIVSRPKMVELVRNSTFEPHELELTFGTRGQALYTVSFTSCVVSPGEGDSNELYMVR
jgi:thiol-disulfide isomerase/thioredoxin